MHIAGEGYKAVSLCLYKHINHRVAVEWLNLTIISNEDTNVGDGGNIYSHAASSNASVEIAFV